MARSRWRWLVAAVVVVVVAGGALVARRGARSWWWDGLATRPVTEAEQAELAACGEVGWPAALKLLVSDADSPCGEAWVVGALAGYARGADHAAWLSERVVSPASAEGTRLRAAWALAAAGRVPPVEPAWLRLRVSEARRASTRAALADPTLAAPLGPGGVALGLAERAVAGEVEAAEALPALRWLAAVGDPEADAAATRAIRALTGVDGEVAAGLHRRRSRGAPVAGSGAPARDVLARSGCPDDRCATTLLAALEAQVAARAAERAEPVATENPADPALDAFLAGVGWSAGDRRAADWQFTALAAWVDGHPERLRSLWTRPGRGPLLRLGWDGSGTPFAVAVVAQRLGAGAARADRADAVWLSIDGAWAARTCGTVGLEPPATDWPEAAVWSRAALEAGLAGGRLARSLDPGLPAPEGGDAVARGIGVALRGDPPAEVDRDRPRDGFCPQ